MTPVIEVSNVAKTFTMHLQGGIRLPVVRGLSFEVHAGECVVLGGPSGAGKSSVLKMIYGTYRCEQGRILVRNGGQITDIAGAEPRLLLRLRRGAIGYVSQFLRAVPRVAAADVVAEPLLASATSPASAWDAARRMMERLNIPERLWSLPPATFSGGEQQRINIARGFLLERTLQLLDEPTASQDAENRQVVVNLINERKRKGAAIVAVVHDSEVRDAIADRMIDMAQFRAAA